MSTVASPAPQESRTASYAMWLSIFSFVLPIGIAALILGYLAQREIRSSQDRLAGDDRARAALIIAYAQISFVLLASLLFWHEYRVATEPFHQDPLVQQIFRTQDKMATLSEQEAAHESEAATALVYQLIAMQDEFHRKSGSYQCGLESLIAGGLEGMSNAEKVVAAERLRTSPYIFEISDCRSEYSAQTGSRYKLIATPVPPRMPDKALSFCADDTGEVRFVRGGTSIDCFARGQKFH